MVISDALTFMAGDRSRSKTPMQGTSLGYITVILIQIGDTFTQGEELKFTGIPNFALNYSAVFAYVIR